MKKYLAVLLMFGCVCRASITLFNVTSREVIREFEDYPTHLSPRFPSDGLRGQHWYLRVANECSSDLPPAPKDADKPWFALLKYNSLCYPQQILNIQSAGYSAAILSNSEYDDEDDDDGVSYYKTSFHSEVKQSSTASNDIVKKNVSLRIPSTFVSNKTEVILAEYSGSPNITMVIYPKRRDFNQFLLILLGTLCLAIVVALVLFMVGYGCYRLYKIRKSIVTKWKLKFLPSHTFRKGDTYEVCVICLDEYLEGARLRILSCGHAFHRKCVDPWLIKSGRECPLCKRKADLRRGRVKKCVGDDDDGSSADERTALLRDEARDLDEEDEDDDIDQVRVMPDQQTTINAIVHSSEDPPRTWGRRNYGSTRSEPPSENLPQIVIRSGRGNAAESESPPKPVDGDVNLLRTSSVHHPIPNFQDEQSRATFYIGSVATDDGGLLDAGDRRPVAEGGENPSGNRRPSDEESEEDYYDVRNEDQVV